MPTGSSVAYVAGNGHRPIPMAKDLLYRDAHAPQAPKPRGLDWSAIQPACTGCGAKSGELNKLDLCPACDPVARPRPAVKPTTGDEPKAAREARRRPTADRRLTDPELCRQIVERYQAGATMREIRRELGPVERTIRRILVAAGVEIRPPHRIAKPKPPKEPRQRRVRMAKPPREPGVRADRSDKITLDLATVVAAYESGQTLVQIAAAMGCSHPVVARHLDQAGVKRRGAPLQETAEQVAELRHLYLDEHLSQVEVAQRMGLTTKGVQNIMARHGIEARPSASTPGVPGKDRSVGLKQQIADLGVSSRAIKEWALREGLIFEIAVGLPSQRIVSAYTAAHPTEDGA